MTKDMSSDVKKFLLSYTSIHELEMLARSELDRINGLLEVEIANQDWFSSVDFETQKSYKWLQVWKKNWHPSVSQRCPWIHFEYGLSWPNQWMQASVDIESQRIASMEVIQDVGKQLYQILLSKKPALLQSQGWLLKHPLEGNRILLRKRQNIIETEFSAEWILNAGKQVFNQLSQIIPFVDQVVEQLFGKSAGSKAKK